MDPKMIQVQSMVNANNVYIDNHFENEKLFKKPKKRIQKILMIQTQRPIKNQ